MIVQVLQQTGLLVFMAQPAVCFANTVQSDHPGQVLKVRTSYTSAYKLGVKQDTKVSGEGGEVGSPDARAEVPLQPLVQPMMKELCLCKPMDTQRNAEIHVQPVEEPMPEQLDGQIRL
ncbi:protein pxr1-like [Willisornis vidua]|uniref:Protein pxr1-like n=1 Tax=Willisornis vidua TaxID=1566151 RepID=A0ABQ9CP20_9PASS|nr:protein pxr1-like [Willisornis vidua]